MAPTNQIYGKIGREVDVKHIFGPTNQIYRKFRSRVCVLAPTNQIYGKIGRGFRVKDFFGAYKSISKEIFGIIIHRNGLNMCPLLELGSRATYVLRC